MIEIRAGTSLTFSALLEAVTTIGSSLVAFVDSSANATDENPIAIAIAPTKRVGCKEIDMMFSIHSPHVND